MASTYQGEFVFRARELLPKIHRRLLEATHKSPKEGRTDHGWSDVKELLRTLKQAVIDDPVLQLPDHTKPFEVHTHGCVRLCHRRCASTRRSPYRI